MSLSGSAASGLAGQRGSADALPVAAGEGHCRGVCQVTQGMASQLALGSVALQASGKPMIQEEFRKMVMQAVKEIAMHESGHTLGLRHNFKASSIYSLDEMNAPERIGNSCLGGSVMDYLPTNLMPKGYKQGDYFSTTIGPYDYWAIEYAYKPLVGGTEGETAELKKIAARWENPLCNMPPTRTPAASTPTRWSTATTWARTPWRSPRRGRSWSANCCRRSWTA